MTGVSHSAWRPITAVAYVPGVMALRSDIRIPITTQYQPLPLAAGPVCDRCWIGRRVVVAVGGVGRSGSRCSHRVVDAAAPVCADAAGTRREGEQGHRGGR